jgi:glycosyltransferase involved in cell wall biosynthesis
LFQGENGEAVLNGPVKKKLTIDARMIHHAGIGTYIQNLIPRLADHYRIFLLVAAEKLQEFTWAGRVEIIGTDSPIYSVGEQLELPHRIPSADAFWSPHYNIPVLPVRAKRRIVTIHDVFHLAFNSSLPLLQRIYSQQMFRRVIKKADKIITVSNNSFNEICRFTSVFPELVTVIYNGIDRELFRVERDRNILTRIRQKYGLPGQFILSVGSIKPHKNLKRLLLAFRQLENDVGEIKLVLAGKEEGLITRDRESASLINDDPDLKSRVMFTGWIPPEDLPRLYNMASLFVFPSLYEGFGFPPLEAMACGCPVLVSDIAVLREICENTAAYVDPLNVQDIAAGLRRLLTNQDLRHRLRETGFRWVARFDWQESAERHMEVIDRVIAGK